MPPGIRSSFDSARLLAAGERQVRSRRDLAATDDAGDLVVPADTYRPRVLTSAQ
jgi:hypothetical protein